MCHANVIVLITPKDKDEVSHPNLWKQPYALPNGKVGRSAEDAVRKMLAPYGFFTGGDWPAGVEHCIGWDGYWIGGGWGGQFDPQYDLMKDPRNQEQCTLCYGKGTGMPFRLPGRTPDRPTSEQVCELCHGTGRCAKPAYEWTPVDGDIAPVTGLPENLDAYAVITPDGIWHECGEWFGEVLHEPDAEGWEAEIKRLLEPHPDAVAVNVDIHC